MNRKTRTIPDLDSAQRRLANLIDPFDVASLVIDNPTNSEVSEYLRHSNANFAYDATRKLYVAE